MPPRVAYWCSSFDAEIEAVAGEVARLRTAFPGSVTWGVAARDWVQMSPKRGFGVHPRLQLLFRGITWLAQHHYDIQHLFGGVGDWFHLTAVSRKPVVLTVAVDSEPCEKALLDKVDRFVVEWPAAAERLAGLGVGIERIRTIYPPVDVRRFSPAQPPEGPFTVLFASSPEKATWLKARGVDLILDAAQCCPDYRFVLVWRSWGNSLATVEKWIKERGLRNVEVAAGRFNDMAGLYHSAHVTVAPFTDPLRCKSAPNSIVEGLACGRPAVVTRCVGLAPLIEQDSAGMVAREDGQDLARCFTTLRDGWDDFSQRARALAERELCQDRFLQSYRQLYSELL